MKGSRKGENRAKESKPREPGTRRCAKCGRLDFILKKKMGIKSGFTFWNLVFLLTLSCVKGDTMSHVVQAELKLSGLNRQGNQLSSSEKHYKGTMQALLNHKQFSTTSNDGKESNP
ncbi:CUB and sushi domain-containing protein 3 [Cricetulus griseus]|nr:CUB and sushi domain-containing protein 3 [Cricetulus griseus]